MLNYRISSNNSRGRFDYFFRTKRGRCDYSREGHYSTKAIISNIGTCQPCLHPLRLLGTAFYEGHRGSFLLRLSWTQPLNFSTGFSLRGPGTEGADLPIVGTSLYLRVGFVKSGSSQTCQTSVPRHPPPPEADARQLLYVAYRGWVRSVQFIFILSIKSPFALLNLTLRMPNIPSQDFELELGQDWTQDSTIFRFPAIFTSCKSHEG